MFENSESCFAAEQFVDISAWISARGYQGQSVLHVCSACVFFIYRGSL